MSDYSIPSLRKYAYLGNFDVAIKELADMARPERWDYVETPEQRKTSSGKLHLSHVRPFTCAEKGSSKGQLHKH